MIIILYMPEADIILYYVHKLQKFLGKKLDRFSTRQASFDVNATIVNIECNGKRIWFELDNCNYIHVHLGLAGYISNEPNEYTYHVFYIGQDSIYINDKIKLSKVLTQTKKEHDETINSLGVYIFSKRFTPEIFLEIIRQYKRKAICSVLMDQHIISGIGNYIKNESLYISKTNVFAKCSELTDDNVLQLYNAILFVAYSLVYTTLANHPINRLYYNKNFKKNNLEIPYCDKIYGKNELDDGTKVTMEKIHGRNTLYIK